MNAREVVIAFEALPAALCEMGFEEVLRRSLQLETKKIFKWLCNMITTKPTRDFCNKNMFIPYKQKIGNQSWRREAMGYAVLLGIFGVKYGIVSEYIVKRTKKVVHLHILSTSAIKILFTLDGVCHAEVHLEDLNALSLEHIYFLYHSYDCHKHFCLVYYDAQSPAL